MSSVSCRDQGASESNYHRLRQALCDLPYIICKEELSLSLPKERTLQYSLSLMNLLAAKREDLLRVVAERRKQLLLTGASPPSTKRQQQQQQQQQQHHQQQQQQQHHFRGKRQRCHNRSSTGGASAVSPPAATMNPPADLDTLAAFSPSSFESRQPPELSARLSAVSGTSFVPELATASSTDAFLSHTEDSSLPTGQSACSSSHGFQHAAGNTQQSVSPSRWSPPHPTAEMVFAPWPLSQPPTHRHHHHHHHTHPPRSAGQAMTALSQCEKICGI